MSFPTINFTPIKNYTVELEFQNKEGKYTLLGTATTKMMPNNEKPAPSLAIPLTVQINEKKLEPMDIEKAKTVYTSILKAAQNPADNTKLIVFQQHLNIITP